MRWSFYDIHCNVVYTEYWSKSCSTCCVFIWNFNKSKKEKERDRQTEYKYSHLLQILNVPTVIYFICGNSSFGAIQNCNSHASMQHKSILISLYTQAPLPMDGRAKLLHLCNLYYMWNAWTCLCGMHTVQSTHYTHNM